MSVANEIAVISKALKEDEGYWFSWQANIAMAFCDEWQRSVNNGGLPCTPEQIHKIANAAANYFLQNLTRETK